MVIVFVDKDCIVIKFVIIIFSFCTVLYIYVRQMSAKVSRARPRALKKRKFPE